MLDKKNEKTLEMYRSILLMGMVDYLDCCKNNLELFGLLHPENPYIEL